MMTAVLLQKPSARISRNWRPPRFQRSRHTSLCWPIGCRSEQPVQALYRLVGIRPPWRAVRCEKETLSTRPMPRYRVATELPPALKNGRVMPITGSSRRFIPRLMMDWEPTSASIPTHR